MQVKSRAMWALGGLIMIASVVLVVGSEYENWKKDWIRDDGSLFSHPEPSDDLSQAQLTKGLEGITSNGMVNDRWHILDRAIYIVYKTKKDEIEPTVELSVNELVACNDFKLEHCSVKHFKWRGDTLAKIRYTENGYNYGLSRYLQATLYKLIERCYAEMDEVVRLGYNTKGWLEKLNGFAEEETIGAAPVVK